MAKIDLIDNSWVDLVFEGKNQNYGAYQLRKNTGSRNVKAMLIMLAIGIAIAAFVAIKGVVERTLPSRPMWSWQSWLRRRKLRLRRKKNRKLRKLK